MSQEQGTPELTVRAIVFGLTLSIVMGAANVYFGLKAGMTVSASIPAAVIAMGIFRLLPRRGSILESNLVQTAASAGESLAAGIIFTMPALVLIHQQDESLGWESFRGWEPFLIISVVALAGGLLGILFMIPMRKVFVVDNQDLRYPEGVACAEVLEAGESAGRDALLVIFGILAGAVVKVLTSFIGLVAGIVQGATNLGARVLYCGAEISPGLVAVGYIVGLPISILIVLGGAIGWLVGIPALGGFDPAAGSTPLEYANAIWASDVRYIGVGAMVVGGLVTIFKVRGGLVAAIRELRSQFGGGGSAAAREAIPRTERNIGGLTILVVSALCIVAIFTLYEHLTGGLGISAVTTVAMVVLAFFFTAVASYIVGLVGNSNSPVSGMTITAVLATAALVALFGFEGGPAILATLGVAGVVCCTTCTAGDVCNDLKTGQIVGASPRSQQILQILGVLVAAFVMWPTLLLLDRESGGIGGAELSAPQASLFASLTTGFFGGGELPKDKILIGAVLGVALVVVDWILDRVFGKERVFHLHIMPVAVGIYLPFAVSTPILLGGLVAWLTRRLVRSEKAELAIHGGVLLGSGLIAGESLTGVGLAIVRFAGLEPPSIDFGAALPTLLGLAALAAVGGGLLLVGRWKTRAE